MALVQCESVLAKTAFTPSNQVITWYRAYFPPVTIPEGDNAESGFFDQVMHLTTERLPGYTHHYRTANFKRIMKEMRTGNAVCCPSLYKTPEREQFIAFSIPALVVLPNGIIIAENDQSRFLPYLDENGRISLTDLLNNSNLTLGISNGRLYSGGIDEILTNYQHSGNSIVHSGKDVFRGLLSMLFKGRVDYILGYPTEARYFSATLGKHDESKYYPIQENEEPITIGYIGCAKTPWGEKLIDQINMVLQEYRETDTFLDFYSNWLDASTRATYRSTAKDYFSSETHTPSKNQ